MITPAPRRSARLAILAISVVTTAVLSAAPAATAAHGASRSEAVGRSSEAVGKGSEAVGKGFPTFVKGMAVNAATGAHLSGIVVTLRDPVSLDLIATDTTNANGVFRMDGLDSDEYAIKFTGARRGFETGYGGCGHGVVPSFDDACTFAPGPLGKWRLDHL